MAIKEEWLDEVLKGCKTPEDITGPNGGNQAVNEAVTGESTISGDDGTPGV